ncbi:MAG: helix-turn-helix domain-containing protein [Rhodospirillales bacterium]|nr:helix-turn-helix domain-containing protein [Rhodospirillales bacterium]
MSYRAAVARPDHPTEHLTQADCLPDGPAGTPEHADLTASLHPAGIAPTHGLCCACKPSAAGTSSSTGFGRVSQGPPVARPESAVESSGRTGRPPDEPAGRPLPADHAALLYPAEAAHILGLSPRTLEHYRIAGGGPPYVSIGRRCVRYRRSDLIAWIDSRCRRHTSDPEPSR